MSESNQKIGMVESLKTIEDFNEAVNMLTKIVKNKSSGVMLQFTRKQI